jgi:hypothetical protein
MKIWVILILKVNHIIAKWFISFIEQLTKLLYNEGLYFGFSWLVIIAGIFYEWYTEY